MAKGKNQHVVPKGDNWAIRGAGNEKVTKIVSTQAEAIKVAKSIAINQDAEMLIHRPNGQIREKNTYGKDNSPPKG